MKPFWVGFQLTLGVIAGCIAIPLVLFFVGLANRAPQLWSVTLGSALAGGIFAALRAARKATVPAALAAPEPAAPWETA